MENVKSKTLEIVMNYFSQKLNSIDGYKVYAQISGSLEKNEIEKDVRMQILDKLQDAMNTEIYTHLKELKSLFEAIEYDVNNFNQ